MRVIAGRYKGRNLVAPKLDARPTLDRTKETLFNIIQQRINGSRVLDLFAGSGQLAIEALSRGAQSAVLCDNNRLSVDAIKQNFAKIGVSPTLFTCDFENCLRSLSCKSMDIVFVDPPYKSDLYQKTLMLLDKYDILSENGIVVCEHSREDELPAEIGVMVVYDTRKIGTVQFTFYCRRVQ